MRQFRSRSISECLDITSEFEVRLNQSAPATSMSIYQGNHIGGYYSVPIYTVPAGRTAKIMGTKVCPICIYRYKTAEGGSWTSQIEQQITNGFRLKINNHTLSQFGGLPNVTTEYTVTTDQYMYLDEGDTLEFVITNNNIVHSSGSSATRYYDATLDSLLLDIYISIIEEYNE